MVRAPMLPALVVAASLLAANPSQTAAPTRIETPSTSVFSLSEADFIDVAIRDLKALRRYATGLRRVQTQLADQKALFNKKGTIAYSPDEKRLLLSSWAAMYDYTMSAEVIRQRYWDFVVVPPTNTTKHAWGYLLTHLALTTELAHGITFTDRTAGQKQLEVVLDEPSAEYGIPPRAYEQFKYKVIHVSTSTQLMTGDAYGASMVPFYKKAGMAQLEDVKWAQQEMKLNSKAAKDKLLKRGVTLFAKNAVDIAADTTMRSIFPMQKGVAEWMGDTRVARINKPLIKREQAEALTKKMEPGDVIVSRQNWFISNVGLPGFWPHAEMYLGTQEQFAAYFDGDPEVQAWAKSQDSKATGLSSLLKNRFPDRWSLYGSMDFHGEQVKFMEAISEGVSFTGVGHAMTNDYVGVMRPRLSKLDKAKAMVRAFTYQGRPYDFDFDFFSDSSLVCSELVWKAYQPSKDMTGLSIPLVNIAGRMALPPNDIVRQFDEEAGKPDRQFDFVAFLDGREKTKDAVEADEATFRQTYRRQKWDILQK
jgi:hypothetical protein